MTAFLPRRDALIAIAVVMVWGTHFAVIKMGVSQVTPMVALTLRFGLTALLFLPFAKMPDRKAAFKIAEIGLLMGVFHQGLLFMGVQRLDAASVAVLIQSQTIFSVLLGRIVLGEYFAWRTTLGLCISAVGLLVMLGVPDVASSPTGFLMVIVSALILSMSYVRMRQLPTVQPMAFIAIINLVSFPFAALGSLALGGVESWTRLGQADWAILGGVLAYQALVISFSHVLWQRLLARNEVAKVTCFSLLTAPVAILVSVMFMDTQVTPTLLAGAGLITAGLGVVVIRRVQKHRNAPITLME